MPIQLRISDNDPYVYMEPVVSGSVAIGTDDADSNKLKIVMSDAVSDLDPGSGTASISIDPTANGDIEFSPKGSGQSTFINGNVEILGSTTDGNLLMQLTAVGGAKGVIEFGGSRFIHNFGTENTFVGKNAGNFNAGIGAQNTAVGSTALTAITTGIANVAVGDGALTSATVESGAVAIGYRALHAITTSLNGNTAVGYQVLKASATDHYNTGVGFNVLAALNGGNTNTALGASALQTSVSDSNNTALGYATLAVCNGGNANTAVGSGTMIDLTTGDNNTGVGEASLSLVTTGSNNTVIGQAGLFSVLSGSNNIAIGNSVGSTYVAAESSNIIIGNIGTVGDTHKIIIGTQGAGAGQQNTCFIAGINGTSVTAAGSVVISSTGQLGTTASFNTTWSVITADQTAAVNNGYICNKGSALLLALPTTSAVGDTLEVTGINTALGWKVTQAAGQQIFFGTSSTTAGATGFLQSSNIRDSIKMVCVVANLTWNVISSVGNVTVF